MTGDVASVYARAIVELAGDRGALDDLSDAAGAFARAFDVDPDIRALILNPGIERRRKCAALRAALDPVLPPWFVDFLCLVIVKGREHALRTMFARIGQFVLVAKGVVSGEAVSAAPLDPGVRSALEQALGRRFGASVLMTERLDPAVVGGVILRYRDRVVDGSVRGRLRGLRARIRRHSVGSEFFDENQS